MALRSPESWRTDMIDILVRLLVLLAAFASVYLLSQVVLGLIWSSRARFAAVNQRLELIRRGASTEQVMAKLRKNAPMEFAGLQKSRCVEQVGGDEDSGFGGIPLQDWNR